MSLDTIDVDFVFNDLTTYKNSISLQVGVVVDTKVYNTVDKYYDVQYQQNEKIGWIFQILSGKSIIGTINNNSYLSNYSVKINYTPDGNEKLTVKGIYQYKRIITQYYWGTKYYYDDVNRSYGGDYFYQYDDLRLYDYRYRYELWNETPDENGFYHYRVFKYDKKVSTSTQTLEKVVSKSFFGPPLDFTFNNCTKNEKWKITESISTLITNINDFQKEAKKWKQWKDQSTPKEDCPSFSDGTYLSANQLNAIYKYVGLSSSYKKGDRVTALMFNTLADRINS